MTYDKALRPCYGPAAQKPSGIHSSLWVTRPLRIAAHNLNFLGLNIALVIQPEVDILDQECPDLVAESIGIQVALDCTI